MSSCCRFLVINGVISQSPEIPQISSFLETHLGAYTTTRTHNSCTSILFWERHLGRLTESARILAESRPDLLFNNGNPPSSLLLSSLSLLSLCPIVNDSLRKVIPVSLKERSGIEELAITTLASGNDVYMHIGMYVPPVFGSKENGAHLAVVGPGRGDVARAKFSEWVRIRKSLEKLRPPLANELLLSNDGDRILEGCLTNFFVVCLKENNASLEECIHDPNSECPFEVQTAPLSDDVLPGIIRQLVIEVCLARRIPFREVAPHWSQHELWQEAFITNSLRLVQHVETIRVPSSWELLELKTWKEVNWEEKSFKEGPGILTSEIQKEIMKRADLEVYPLSDFT